MIMSTNLRQYFRMVQKSPLKQLIRLFIIIDTILIFSACKSDNYLPIVENQLATTTTPASTPKLEQEVTVTLDSYWGPEVRKAEAEDILTRINAAYLYLENGDETEANADIYYRLTCGSICSPVWTAMKGAIIVKIGQNQPSLDGCVKELHKADAIDKRLSVLIAVPNYYSCILTKSGRVGWVRYDDDFRYGLEKGKSQITYWLWDEYFSELGQ